MRYVLMIEKLDSTILLYKLNNSRITFITSKSRVEKMTVWRNISHLYEYSHACIPIYNGLRWYEYDSDLEIEDELEVCISRVAEYII